MTPVPAGQATLEPAAPAPRGRRSRRGRRIGVVEAASWAVVIASIAGSVAAPLVAGHDPMVAISADRLLPPGSAGHLLGTDGIGRDGLSRVLYSGRIAWQVALSVSAFSVVVGAGLGLLAGYFRGRFDRVLTRVMDGALAFPPLLLALVLAAILGGGTWTSTLALSLVYTPLAARVARAGAMAERELDYVLASRGLGHRETRTLWRHVTPNVLGPILVAATIIGSRAMILEASLSFLGVGTQPPTPSLGLMIADARPFLLSHPHAVLVPAAALSAMVLAVNLLADALADRLDPRGRVRRAATEKVR